jgi:hypothetical protein
VNLALVGRALVGRAAGQAEVANLAAGIHFDFIHYNGSINGWK